jgi:hypothetical protein
MAELASAMKNLEGCRGRAGIIRPLILERDSPSALKQYLSSFNSQFLGRGDDRLLGNLSYLAFSQKQAEAPRTSVAHNRHSVAFIF